MCLDTQSRKSHKTPTREEGLKSRSVSRSESWEFDTWCREPVTLTGRKTQPEVEVTPRLDEGSTTLSWVHLVSWLWPVVFDTTRVRWRPIVPSPGVSKLTREVLSVRDQDVPSTGTEEDRVFSRPRLGRVSLYLLGPPTRGYWCECVRRDSCFRVPEVRSTLGQRGMRDPSRETDEFSGTLYTPRDIYHRVSRYRSRPTRSHQMGGKKGPRLNPDPRSGS